MITDLKTVSVMANGRARLEELALEAPPAGDITDVMAVSVMAGWRARLEESALEAPPAGDITDVMVTDAVWSSRMRSSPMWPSPVIADVVIAGHR